MEKMGIENLKLVVKFGVSMGQAIDVANDDGKITIADAGLFYPVIMAAPGAIGAAKMVIPEFKDLDQAELAELSTFVVTELKIVEAKVLAVIQASLKLAAGVYETVEAVKALKEE